VLLEAKKRIVRLPLTLHSGQGQGPLRMTTYSGSAQIFENFVTSVIGWKLRWMLFEAGVSPQISKYRRVREDESATIDV
jgi:hypothetical protein